MATAIEFNNVGKMYRLGLVGTGTLSDDLNRWWTMNVLRKEDPYLKIGQTNDRTTKGDSDYVWALRDISFKVEQGDVVGIIGKNGAGKSTLLKLLSHITAPTTGSIRYNGRIASLLEVGTGFHPEMTGRENIYMNGSIMGMTKAEITRKLDEIVDFAGVERYLDTPTKRYSSGMKVRLGFAVAAFLEPEILVVDEVLTVGDAEFQKKAIGKMNDVAHGEGRTVLFVSHNMGAVRQLCNNGVVLKNGQLDFIGTAEECVNRYVSENIQGLGAKWDAEIKEDKDFQLVHVELQSSNGHKGDTFSCDEEVDILLTVHIRKRVPGIWGFLKISKEDGTIVWVSDSNDKVMNTLEHLPEGKSKIRIRLPKRTLAPGKYSIYFNFTSKHNNSGFTIDSPGDVCTFVLTDDMTRVGNVRKGCFSTLLDWEII